MELEPNGMSILAVEDDNTTREMLRLFLGKRFPYMPLYFAENGKKGVELFNEYTPEIVITDIVMPEMDGVEMAMAIKALKSDTMFIVISGYNTPVYHEKFSNLGSKF